MRRDLQKFADTCAELAGGISILQSCAICSVVAVLSFCSCQTAVALNETSSHAGNQSKSEMAPGTSGLEGSKFAVREFRDGEILALCTVRETETGVVHRLEFLFNQDLGMYEVDHTSVDADLQESFRSYFARGNLRQDGIALELQESVSGHKFAVLKADPRGQKGLLLGTVVFTQLHPVEQDNAECSVNY